MVLGQMARGDDSHALLDTPPDCLYLADPDRLSVLGITIVARASSRPNGHLALHVTPQDAPYPHSSSSTGYGRADNAPPSAYNNIPGRAWHPPPSSSSRAQATTSRSRPKSVEIGSRAKEALRDFKDLGKGVTQGWRNSSRVDLSSSLEEGGNESSKSSMAFQQIYNLEPHSHETSQSVRLHITSKVQYCTSDTSHLGDGDVRWTTLGSVPVDFCRDDAAQLSESRAGIFESHCSETSISQDEESKDRRTPLEVSPPVGCLGRVSNAPNRSVATQIMVKTQLRVHSSSSTSSSFTATRISPAGPRAPQKSLHAKSTIVFAYASSPSKLMAAVLSSGSQRDGGRPFGPLASTEAARLEGIECVLVDQSGVTDDSRVIDFSCAWKDISRGGSSSRDALPQNSVDCVCAFIELEDGRNARVLASFRFGISFSVTSNESHQATATSSPLRHCKSDDGADGTSIEQAREQNLRWPSNQPHPTPAESSEYKSGVGLGLHGLASPDLQKGAIGQTSRSTAESAQLGMRETKSSMESATAKESDISEQSTTRPSMGRIGRLSEASPIDVNVIEIDLADVEEDGPILRAALQNLEKRSANLKRAAKTAIKAAADVREKLSLLQASQEALGVSMQSFSQLMPSTIGHLDADLLISARSKAHTLREQETEMLRLHVEQPLQLVVDQCKATQEQLKSFEAESRAYYLGTQKWLAGKAASPQRQSFSANGRDSHDVYSPTAVGFDKSSLRQDIIDDRQRLRQIRFHLARLEIYHAVSRVHGGELELKLATNILVLSKWQCTDATSQSQLQSFEAGLQVELGSIQEKSDLIRRKYLEVERQYLDLQELMRGSAGDAEAEAFLPPSSEGLTVLSAARRQAGVKLKNILSTFSNNRVSQNSAAKTTWDSHEPHTNPDDSPVKLRGGLYSPLLGLSSQQSPSARVVPSMGAAMSPRQGTFHSPQTPSHVQERSVSDSMAYSPVSRGFPSESVSPNPRRTKSVTVAPLSPSSMPPPSSYIQARSRGLKVGLEQGLSHTSSEGAYPAIRASCDTVGEHVDDLITSKRASLLQPRRAAVQQSRKKEGVLWAISKPITGSVGADAPKAVSRAQNWKECWVVLSGSGHLGQYENWKDVKGLELSQPLIDLRFATVRPARNVERRFTFEIVTRECRRFFQASNDQEMKEWIAAIGLAIESLLNGTSSIRQTEKVARAAGSAGSHALPFIAPGDDFGPKSATAASSGIAKQREFSQSLTDLSSAKANGPARLFMRSSAMAKEEASRKRQSKGSYNFPTGHVLTHSEGAEPSLSHLNLSSAPICSSAWTRHERGISNKTPISGYLAQTESSHVPSYTCSPQQLEFDRQIEEMVQSHFGVAPSTAHQRDDSARSVSEQYEEPLKDAAISNKYTRSKEIMEIANEAGNKECADCKSRDPRWASWNLNGEPQCIFICISCSGVHRSLGVSISKVKSVDLDDWTEEQVESARRWGNQRVNEEYEARKPPDATVERQERQFWVSKYVDRAWYEARRVERIQSETARAEYDEADDLGSCSDDSQDSLLLSRSISPPIDEKWDGKWSSLHNAMARTKADGDGERGKAHIYPASLEFPGSKRKSLQRVETDANTSETSGQEASPLPRSPSLKSSKRFGRYSISQQISPSRPAATLVV